jgi:hypothetical protein
MANTGSRAVADKFFKAWTTGGVDTAHSLLRDNVSLSGPTDKFDNADAYIGALRGLAQIVKAAEEQKVFVDRNDVCVISDLVTNTPAVAAPTAEWYHVPRAGRQDLALRVFFDARPLAPLFEQRAGH